MRIEFAEHDFSDPSAGLRSRTVDRALVCAPIDPTGLLFEPREQAPRVAVVSERHPLAGRQAVALADLFDDR